ncbi:MAG: magnesium transporter [Planctomycetota bacterium]|nr:magnesium transporter [Planctomycetota bacterium]MCX8040489.1 magnesium transporter [Planctomycetota bacterium]
MIVAWAPADKGLERRPLAEGAIPPEVVWLDCIDITPEEERLVETKLAIEMPTRAEMQEIEASSRLYREGNAVYMTATMLIKTETEQPETTPVTFILTRSCLVTLRYAEPWSFRTFSARAAKCGATTAELVFIGLLETTVERLADMLELVSLELERIQQQIFRRHGTPSDSELERVLFKIGHCGNITGKIRESLVDKNRLLVFSESASTEWCPEGRARIRAARNDIASLADHATFTAGKIGFLLDATLGLINNNVNQQMKRMTMVMVGVLWPALVSGFFAMNVALPFPAEEWWPFYLCLLLAFGPLVIGFAWLWWKRRHRRLGR